MDVLVPAASSAEWLVRMCLDSLVGLPMELEGGCSGLGVEVLTAGIEVVWRRKSEGDCVFVGSWG
jgi:hypothetical protein